VLHVLREKCGEFSRVSIQELIKAIVEIERVSAIEVLDPNGNGTIFYPDWK
jgi:hypothetical protein